MHAAELRSNLSLGHPEQYGETAAIIIIGNIAGISHLCDFSFYDWCWARSPRESNQPKKQLVRWCGPSFDIGDVLCYSLINANFAVIHLSSVIPLKKEERYSDEIKEMKLEFNETLKNKLGERAKGNSLRVDPKTNKFLADDTILEYEPYQDDEDPEVDKLGNDTDPLDVSPVS